MIPDPEVAAATRAQLIRLEQLEVRLAAWCAHPPAVSVRDWDGPAAQAHGRAAVALRLRLSSAHDGVVVAIARTRAELVRAGG